MPRPSRNSNKIESPHSSPRNKNSSSAETTPTPPTILGDTTEEDTDHAIDVGALAFDGASENRANKKESDNNVNKLSSSLGKRILSAINNVSEEKLLQVIVVAADDRSLEMSLDTEYATQSLMVNSMVKNVAITPIPSTWLQVPIHIRVRIYVRHNGRWIKPCKTMEFSNAPDVFHSTFVVMLNCGLNIIDIFVKPPKENNSRKKKKFAAAEDGRRAVYDRARDVEKGKVKDLREKVSTKAGVDKDQSSESLGLTKEDEDDHEDSDEHCLELGQQYTLFITRLEEEN